MNVKAQSLNELQHLSFKNLGLFEIWTSSGICLPAGTRLGEARNFDIRNYFFSFEKEEGMGLIKIFTKAKCPRCPAVKEIGKELKKDGVPVLSYDLDTIDGLAEASFYSILSTPSIVIEDEEEKEVVSWRGVVPTLQEVRHHLPPCSPALETVS